MLILTMVIIGGFGSWMGALVGAILITWLPLRLESLSEWWYAIYGAIMIIMATFIPGGLYGLARDLRRRSVGMRTRRRGGPRRVAQPVQEPQA